jgi:nicotinate phosphoribosyltransferase
LEQLRFTRKALDYLAAHPVFTDDFLDWLARLRFEGDVYAVPEGTPVFAEEPLVEIVAPLPQAQLIETLLLNQVHLQTMLASKAARVVRAAAGRPVVDFGLRRMHGADAGLKAARAFYIAGIDATSNVLSGCCYGIPIAGTMAHSYVQAHPSELDAFRAFVASYPDTTLLVDTYDTLAGVQNVVSLARELGPDFRVRAIRLDSGDLASLSKQARQLLDASGLSHLKIFASGGLDETELDRLVRDGAPIDGFGVGTSLGVSRDEPALDAAYKLTSYAGQGRLKRSPGKRVLPGRKQVYRVEHDGQVIHDVIARAEEALDGRPLLRKMMERGQRLAAARETLEASRSRAQREVAALPERIQSLEPASRPYAVMLSHRLVQYHHQILERSG